MQTTTTRRPFAASVALIAGFAVLLLAGYAVADPPLRVARLAYISGEVSFSPAGESEWVRGVVNRPLITGDRLWVAQGARAELQIGVAAVRIGASTSLTLLNLDDDATQFELAQGSLNIRVRRLSARQEFEIDTPNLAYSLRQPGDYRIDADPATDATMVLVRGGQAEVYGEGEAYTLAAGQSYRYYGSGLRDYEVIDRPRADEFDRWAADRDRFAASSVALRYVSPDVIGYEDLDANGTWRSVAGYGNVWVPSRVDAGWAPYRDGHWSWVEPWGWTWVDDAPWGFAVSHYGRWANLGGTWGWVPGPIRQQAVYAPALVGFVGGNNFRLSGAGGNVSGIAWFPLGPRDVYRPSYPVSREYFTRVNSSNTVITNSNITNLYNNNSARITYINQRVPGAVVAVPATAFVQSQPVAHAAVRFDAGQLLNAPVSSIAAVVPVQRSVVGAAAPVVKPAMTVGGQRPFVARTAPPPPAVGFAARETALAATPGRPLATSEIQRLKPANAPVPAPQVLIAAPPMPAVPMTSAQPSRAAPVGSMRGAGREGAPAGQRGRPGPAEPPTTEPPPKPQPASAAPAVPTAPAAPAGALQPPVAAPGPAVLVPPNRRGGERPGPQMPDTSPRPNPVLQPSPAPTVPKPEPAPQARPQPVVAAPAEPRMPPERRGRPEPQGQTGAAPVPAMHPAAPAAQPVAPPAPPVAPVAHPAAPPVQPTGSVAQPPGRPPEGNQGARPPAPAHPGPATAPVPGAEQRGPGPKPGAPKVDERRGPEQPRQDEQKQEEEKKGRKPN